MSRIAWLVAACGLALAAPVFADEIKLAPPTKSAEQIAKAMQEKVEIDGAKIGDLPLFEGLTQLSKRHDIQFVVMEQEFIVRGVKDIKEKKSFLKSLDTKGLTVRQFLSVWLASVGATYKVHADHVAVVPMTTDLKKGERKADTTELTLSVLLDVELQLKEGANINEIPLFELLTYLSKMYDLNFVVCEELFKEVGEQNIREAKAKIAATQFRGLKVHQFLKIVLESMDATFLVKKNVIEIVPTKHAAKVTKAAASEGESGRVRLDEPLVCLIVKDKPLNEVVAKLAEDYDLNVTVSPQAGDAKTGFVTARLLNVPADKAIETLALQCDLRVVRKGNVFLLTGKDHANELFNEKLDKERQKIELDKLREAPAKPPAPPVP